MELKQLIKSVNETVNPQTKEDEAAILESAKFVLHQQELSSIASGEEIDPNQATKHTLEDLPRSYWWLFENKLMKKP
jgi:hypothetical protein